MAEQNNSMLCVNNTDTESILLDKISANSTPRAVENKISLEDLFALIKTQNSVLKEIDEKFDSLENELKKQNNVRDVKLNQLDEKLKKVENEIHKQNSNVNEKINIIETQCNDIKKHTEIVDEQIKTCLLYTSILNL